MFALPSLLAWGALAAALAALLCRLGASRRDAATAKMGRLATLSRLIPAETAARRRLKAWLSCAAIALLFVALAGPQWGVELTPTESKTRAVVIGVDLSLSMLAEDVKPSRLEKAKEELSLLLDQLKGERVGVLGFAGDAFMMCPMTTDVDAAKQILSGLSPDSVPVPGTAIGAAIRTATQQLSRYGGEKALVLITDGEDHKTDPQGASVEAAEAGVKIYAIGIGTQEGEPIPVKDQAGSLEGYKKDKRGSTVVSKLGEGLLTEITQKTGGAYYRASPGEDEVGEIVQRVERGEKGEAVEGTSTHYQNRFMIPLSVAFVLLLIELLIPERKTVQTFSKIRNIIRHVADDESKKAAIIGAILIILGLNKNLSAATAEGALRRGNKLYQADQYEPALEQYAVSGAKSPKDARPVFNAGDALYRLQRLDEASEAFKAVAGSKLPSDVRSAAYYNLGNARYQAGDVNGAIDAFRKAVLLDPKDAEARHNLAVALKNQKNPRKKPDPKKNQNQKDEKKDQQQKDQPQPQKNDQGRPPEPKTRPQDQMSKEDAERIMRAVADKERSAAKQQQLQKEPNKKPDVEEDW